jgi:hypothetical protein
MPAKYRVSAWVKIAWPRARVIAAFLRVANFEDQLHVHRIAEANESPIYSFATSTADPSLALGMTRWWVRKSAGALRNRRGHLARAVQPAESVVMPTFPKSRDARNGSCGNLDSADLAVRTTSGKGGRLPAKQQIPRLALGMTVVWGLERWWGDRGGDGALGPASAWDFRCCVIFCRQIFFSGRG